MSPENFCTKHNACVEGAEWATRFATMAEVWNMCQRPDWMLWILDRLVIPAEKERRLFACWCAESTPGMAQLTDPRSIEAVRVARLFALGQATEAELSAAESEAWSAAESAESAESARSAWSAWSASRSAAESAAAESASRSAAESARSAWSAAESAQADALRALIPNPFKAAS